MHKTSLGNPLCSTAEVRHCLHAQATCLKSHLCRTAEVQQHGMHTHAAPLVPGLPLRLNSLQPSASRRKRKGLQRVWMCCSPYEALVVPSGTCAKAWYAGSKYQEPSWSKGSEVLANLSTEAAALLEPPFGPFITQVDRHEPAGRSFCCSALACINRRSG